VQSAIHRKLAVLFLSSLLLLDTIPSLPADHVPEHAAAAAPIAEKIHLKGISDAGKVDEFLYRGTQPNEEGVESLKKIGVDTIVDLRGEFHGAMEKERRRAEKLGIRLIFIPGNGWSPPSDKQMAEFFSLFKERPRHRIYVHCWLGGDRAGVFLAAYRIDFDGWAPEQALREMHAFHFHGFWHPAMSAYVRDFPARLKRSPTLAAYRKTRREES
jgi:protein tyrosine phosphatase (PTP) superfamily phosphohydrolase (DUF442 family)